MKLKTVVLLSLVAFALTFGGVLVAGLVFAKTTTQTGSQDGVAGIADGTAGQPSTGTTPNASASNPSQTSSASSAAPKTATSSAAPAAASSSTPAKSSAAPAASSQAPAPTKTTTAPACGSAGGTCSVAQVAAHNSAGNCWVIYNGGYYNVTSYVANHPGGTSVFNSTTCGHDITAYLNGGSATAGAQHRHSASAYSVLNSYYIGKVQ